ncbi:NAD(P)H-dependent oxidoreductase [Kribbella sp. CA-294648]|uniref:NAD(P)H-dependent oxidoreductase n=1 Tax=Kribbella sp. CA-294648 TaxID=3239948 RepID=UPI003D8AC77C
MLKSFLDVLPHQALAGAVVVPVTVSAAPSHRLLADIHLRPPGVHHFGGQPPGLWVATPESGVATHHFGG